MINTTDYRIRSVCRMTLLILHRPRRATFVFQHVVLFFSFRTYQKCTAKMGNVVMHFKMRDISRSVYKSGNEQFLFLT